MFRSLKLEVEPTERVSEHVHVRQQPGREIGGLVRPDLANVEPLDPADVRVHGALAYGDSADSAEPSVIRVDRGRLRSVRYGGADIIPAEEEEKRRLAARRTRFVIGARDTR